MQKNKMITSLIKTQSKSSEIDSGMKAGYLPYGLIINQGHAIINSTKVWASVST